MNGNDVHIERMTLKLTPAFVGVHVKLQNNYTSILDQTVLDAMRNEKQGN